MRISDWSSYVCSSDLKADHVPDVDDLVLVAGDEERLEVDHVPLLVEDEPAEEDPTGMCRAGGEGPLAGQRVATLSQDRLAGRRIGRGEPGGGVLAPYRLLRLIGEECPLPRVHAAHGGDQTGRAVGGGELPHSGEEVDRVALQAAATS